MTKQLDGAELAGFIKERQAKSVRNLRQQWKVVPKLAIVQTVDSSVIDTYVRLKSRYASDILVECELHRVEQDEARAVVERLNADETVHGIIVQLPLADPTQTDELLALVAPEKDVDALGPQAQFDPATPMAIHWLLSGYGIELTAKSVAIVGHGRLVGAPLALLWRASGLEVTVLEKGDDLAQLRSFDVVVTATGQPGLIRADYLKIGAVVVDAGTADAEGQVVGDLAADVRERDDLMLTPEKGGVGPLTIAALMDNVLTAARRTVTTPQD